MECHGQNSFLGPVLFIIYINDLSDIVSSTVKIFVDDTKLYNKDSNCDIFQQDLDALFCMVNTVATSI